jgi:hypothetical protein
MVPGNYWIRAPSPSYFFAIVQAAVGKRFAKILESEQLCRYAQIQASLQGIVCDCTNSGTTDCYDGFSSSVVALAAFCSSIPDSFSEGPVSLSCADDFKVQDTDCLDIKISVIPISQFESRGVSSLSAASISSSRADQRRSALYIKNGAGVAVGQVLSSGSKVETDRSFIGTITVCLTFPADFTSDLPLQLYDYAVPNEDYTQFTPLGMTDVVKPNGTFCFGLVNNSITYFPIGLQENWENAPFISTYFPAEVFYLFFGAIMYLLVLAFTMYHFAVHIRMREVGRPFFNLSTAALLILIIFLMNRFIYMMLIVSGVMDSNGEVEVVFSSFPALLFYVIYSIIVLRWAEIYHFTIEAGQRGGLTKLKPAIIAMNAFLSFAFVLLLILYFTLDDHTPQVINCATPDTELDQMTRGDIVAIIYKVFFATVSVILSVLFVTYGVRVMQLVLKSLKSENVHLQKREARVKAFQKLLVVSCVCTLCLLAQAAFLLWSSVSVASTDEQQQFYGILSFLYATEIPSSIIFVLMFKKASFFIKAGRHGNLAGSTASTSAPTNSYQPMSSMHSATA